MFFIMLVQARQTKKKKKKEGQGTRTKKDMKFDCIILIRLLNKRFWSDGFTKCP